jgi:putative ABC transport system permease protein
MTGPDVPRWRRYLRFWRPDIKADIDDEFEFHLQERVDDLVARGMDARAARDNALRGFGDIESVKLTCREIAAHRENEMRRSEQLGVLRQDVVYALRLLRARPGFTAAIMLTLALGIGATTAIFSVVNAVLLRPLPYADADRMVIVWERLNDMNGGASVGHFHDWTEQTRAFEGLAAFQPRTFNLTDGEPERLFGARVTPNFFQVAYMRPAVGRYFLPGETDASRVAVLSHGLWQTRFGGDSSIVGKQITLNGERHTVVGVTPAAYTLTQFDERLWTPLTFAPEQRTNYGAHFLTVFGKLRPGTTITQAQRDVERVTEGIRRRHPDAMKNRGVLVQSFTEVLVGDYRIQLWVLLGAVTFVLLIGCGNVASLLLARATARSKEIAIRSALGGARRRLVRQLLTESLLLALLGGAAGLVVAHFGIRFLVGMGPQGLPRLTQAALDPAVLAFALAATLACGILFGLAPALRATRVDLLTELREGGRGSGSVARDRVRAALIVTEIAVALVLLVSAGLLLRSAERLQHVPMGFDPRGVTMMRVALPPDRYSEPAVIEATFARIVDQVRAIPGVRSAGAGTRVPMWGPSIDMGVTVDGRKEAAGRVELGHVRMVTHGYMETLRMRLKRGRLLTASDTRAGAPWVIVVNEAFAKSIFGDENPLGRRISGWTSGPAPEWREIVGVVGDVRAFGLENDVPPEMYMPMTQGPGGAWQAYQRGMTIIAQSNAATPIAGAMRNVVKTLDPTLPLFDVQTMDDVLMQSMASRRFNTLLLSFLGLTGLILAAIGIYGVIAFFVTQRTHEIGVRVALGATARDVVRMVVMQAAMLALTGIVIGGAGAYWTTQVLRTMLFEVDARDPIAYAAAAAVLLVVALVAATLPARRAAGVDPVRALAVSG